MADFDLVLVQTIDPERVTYPTWIDPALGADPSRIAPRGHVLHRHARIGVDAGDVLSVEFNAVVGGVQAPADAALGGRLFSWVFSLWPVGAPIPEIASPVDTKTSRARFICRGAYPGHYVMRAKRPSGGSVSFPFDVELDP